MNKTAHNKIIWSNEEVEMLKEKYEIFTNKELSVILNKSTRNVARKLKELSLYKNLDKVRNIKSRINKENGTDLSYDYVANISKKFTTKNEFYQFETNVYNKAVKEGWLKEITNHMIVKRVSLPQLILKDILEFIIDADCSYNDRTVIKPYEIDCYFPTFKIGWEYNGRYFHTDEKDEFKVKLCLDKGISLFSINEKSKTFRKYEKNIKNQLIKQISDINQLTGLNITKEMILNYKINIKPPNVLSDYEKNEVFGKKLSQIRKTNLKLYNKIKNFNIVKDESLGIIDDIKTFKKFENFDEYLEFITDNNISSFNELCKIEHPHRRVKKWGINIKELHNFLTNKKKMKIAVEVQAPNQVVIDENYINIFLAGSIENGKAIEWQKEFIAALSDKNIRFLNPRRDDWDSSWGQTIDDPKFVEQVQWELNSMEMSHIIVMVIDPATLSPVTMIEFGLHAKEQKLMVVCPDGFWKKGNVDVTCEFYGINQFDTMDELIEFMRKHI